MNPIERIKWRFRRDDPPLGAESRMTEIRLLTLEWYVAGEMSGDIASRYLDTVGAVDPRALPRRFAGGEPERGSSATGATGRACFEAAWLEPRLLNWTTSQPYLGGHRAPPPDTPAPEGKQRRTIIKLYVNASALEAQRDACDLVVDVFASVAQATDAFFGAGYVERRHAVDGRGKLWTGPDSESIPWIGSPWWDGLPVTPTWLSWFGPPYASLVADSLEGWAEPQGQGLLVRNGPLPMDVEQAASVALRLPSEIVEVREPVLAEHLSPGLTEPIVIDWGRLPALIIPDLRDAARSGIDHDSPTRRAGISHRWGRLRRRRAGTRWPSGWRPLRASTRGTSDRRT